MKRLFTEKGYEVNSLELINRSNWSGTRIREKMLRDDSWEADVPDAVRDIIEEIDGVRRIRDLSKTDEE